MTLSATQTPQKMFQPKLGSMDTDSMFRPSKSDKTAAKATASAMKEPLLRPCSPASRNREGIMPMIRPTNRQTDGSGYCSKKKESRFAMPRKPTAAPTITGNSFGTCVLKFLNGLDSSSITGL